MKTLGKTLLLAFAAIGFMFILCSLVNYTKIRPDGWEGERVSIRGTTYEIKSAMEAGDGYQVLVKEAP